jgi:hypothetical protein
MSDMIKDVTTGIRESLVLCADIVGVIVSAVMAFANHKSIRRDDQPNVS